jgi:hypothetical protein
MSQQKSAQAASSLADGLVRLSSAILGVLGQIYTIKETIFLLMDVSSGTIDAKFYVSLLVIGIIFPFSLWLVLRTIGNSEFVQFATNAYAFVLSVVSSAYYFAISTNYNSLLNSIYSGPSAPNLLPDTNLAMLAHIGLATLFLMPLVGTAIFSKRAGPDVSGVAAIPLLASFLYGCTVIAGFLRQTDYGHNFYSAEIPRILMTSCVFVVAMNLFSRFLRSR